MTVSEENEIVIYESNDGLVRVDVTLDGDTVWLSLDQLAQLFGRDKSTISRHIKNIYAEGELDQEATVAKNATAPFYHLLFLILSEIISTGSSPLHLQRSAASTPSHGRRAPADRYSPDPVRSFLREKVCLFPVFPKQSASISSDLLESFLPEIRQHCTPSLHWAAPLFS